MDSYKITIAAFDKQASNYQDKYMYLDLYNDTYDAFCRLIENENPKVFEIGCGPGNITKYLLAKRPDFKITAIDMAPNMIKLARINNPSAAFKLMDCREIDKIKDTYDAIMCGFCLPYLSKKDVSKLLNDCSELLNKNGVVYLSTMEGDYEQSGYKTSSDGQDKAFIYYHEHDFINKTLDKSGFDIVEFKRKDFIKPDGSKSVDMIFIARIRNNA